MLRANVAAEDGFINLMVGSRFPPFKLIKLSLRGYISITDGITHDGLDTKNLTGAFN